jgi:5'-deoxynucleotidase YfbR-like HD superfamily hydrolase
MAKNEFLGKPLMADANNKTSRLEELHSLLLEMDRLKTVRRRNPIRHGRRPETTAEHSWHLGVAVMLFARFAVEDIDVDRAVSLAILHDVPEIFVGDTFVYSAEVESRPGREASAMRDFLDRHSHLAEVSAIVSQWGEYESCRSAEGRFVMALDVLLPVFLNHANLAHSSWLRHGISGNQVRDRITRIQRSCPALAELALQLVDDAVNKGVLKTDERSR